MVAIPNERRCIATNNPGRWPYVARCIKQRKHKGLHENQFGQTWSQDATEGDMPAGNGLSVYVISVGGTPFAAVYTWSTVTAVVRRMAESRGWTPLTLLVTQPDQWTGAVEENETDQFHVRRFTLINNVSEFVP